MSLSRTIDSIQRLQDALQLFCLFKSGNNKHSVIQTLMVVNWTRVDWQKQGCCTQTPPETLMTDGKQYRSSPRRQRLNQTELGLKPLTFWLQDQLLHHHRIWVELLILKANSQNLCFFSRSKGCTLFLNLFGFHCSVESHGFGQTVQHFVFIVQNWEKYSVSLPDPS